MSLKYDPDNVDFKEHVSTVEATLEDGLSDQAEIAQTVWRLDLALLPLVIIIYLLAYLDRANVGNARVVSRFSSNYLEQPC